MDDTILELQNITKSLGDTKVLKGISLSIQKGEFITFLGSSGCGKTTTLRIISGLECPDSGNVLLGGKDVTTDLPNKRDVNTIFQNYALFPHMNVFANVAYSLKIKRVPKDEIKRRVSNMLDLVQLTGMGKRMPAELSGGQKQRVAIARAVINNPSVLLLDEPLGALDLQLRRQMQQELKKLQKQLGITFLYITHDQEEAINMSDRIVLMNEGKFEQIGTPAEIYDHPKTSFVAGFIGTANILKGTIAKSGRSVVSILLEDGSEVMADAAGYDFTTGQHVTFFVRSENVAASPAILEHFDFKVNVLENNYVGGMLRIVFETINGQKIVSSRHGIRSQLTLGNDAYLHWDTKDAVFVDMEDGYEENE